MRKFQRLMATLFLMMTLGLMLVACGGNPTPTAVPTTAPKPTTAAATTTAPKPTTATGQGSTGSANRPAKPSGTPTGTGKVPANLPATSDSPVDSLLTNVTKASSNLKSGKFALAGVSGGVELVMQGMFVAPDRVQIEFVANDQQVDVVQIGSDLWLGTGGVVQKVTDPALVQNYVSFLQGINLVTLGDDDIKKYAGSEMAIYPNYKAPDGKDYGVFAINTAGATDPTIKQLGTAIYYYNPQSFQVQYAIISGNAGDLIVALEGINDPNLKIEEPK